METSLMVYDYPTAPESETKTLDFDVYVKLSFKNVEMDKDDRIIDYLDSNGILDYEYFEIQEIEEK